MQHAVEHGHADGSFHALVKQAVCAQSREGLLAEQIKKELAVFGAEENLLPRITTRAHVVERTGNFQAQRTGQPPSITVRNYKLKAWPTSPVAPSPDPAIRGNLTMQPVYQGHATLLDLTHSLGCIRLVAFAWL